MLDFGLASVPTDPSITPSRRGGIPEYYDPQYAAAQRAENREPPLDAAAEQYSVAVLLYTVATGLYWVWFRGVDREALASRAAA